MYPTMGSLHVPTTLVVIFVMLVADVYTSQHEYATSESCKDIANSEREECGNNINNATECFNKGCCWVPSRERSISWCFRRQIQETTDTPPKPPLNATYLMECTVVPGEKWMSVVTDLCWVNENILIGAQTYMERILKFTINTDTRACLTEVFLESTAYLYGVSCSHDKIIVSYISHIRAYNITTGEFEEWGYPDVVGVNHIAINDDLVVLANYTGNKVYSRDNLTYLYKFDVGGEERGAESNYLSRNNIYWACSYRLIQVDLNDNATAIFKDEVMDPRYVSGIPGKYVFVISHMGDQVGVYAEDGTYLNDLQIDKPTVGRLGAHDALERLGKDNLIAFGMQVSEKDPVKIYTLQP